MKHIVFLIFILTIRWSLSAAPLVVVDSSDMEPVIGATVIDRAGVIVGLTDSDGTISVGERHFPVTIRCLGYEAADAYAEDSVLFMKPSALQLREVEVNPVARPVKRVLCLLRELGSCTWGKDTLQLYTESMAVAYVVESKVKGYHGGDSKLKTRSVRYYSRVVDDGKEIRTGPGKDEDFILSPWSSFAAILPGYLEDVYEEASAVIANGAQSDTVAGKYAPRRIYTRKNGVCTSMIDLLANKKDHKWRPALFKLMGMTSDFVTFSRSYSFAENGSGRIGINDFMAGTVNVRFFCKGNAIKLALHTLEPVEIMTFIEIIPVEITSCTVDEYKVLRKDKTAIPFRYPSDLQPLSPAIQRLCGRDDPDDNSR